MEKATLARTPGGIALSTDTASSSIEQQIADFLAGISDGAELLHTLYGHAVDEPVPPRLLETVRRWRPA